MKKKHDGIDVEGKAPGFYLYVADLQRELRPLPPTCKALWIEMLLQMHWSNRRGYLEHPTGEPYTIGDIASLAGIPTSSTVKFLADMERRYGTFSRDERGCIFNRRMVRDTEISAKRKAAGRLGGNPNLVGSLVDDTVKQTGNLDNQKSNLNPTLSSSSSSSTSPKGKTPPNPPTIREVKEAFVPVGRMAEWPLTAIEVRRRFPAASDLEVLAIVQECLQAFVGIAEKGMPPPDDEDLTEAVKLSHFNGQENVRAYRSRASQVVKTWIERKKHEQLHPNGTN